MSDILKAALQYQKQGISIFPCNPYPTKTKKDGSLFQNKQPYLSFIPYRDRLPTEDEIKQWWTKWPNAMIGCITGEVPNNLTVIDIDSEEAYKALQEYIPESYITRIAKSPKGYHLYFKYFEGPPNDSDIIKNVIPKIDCRTNGGYIIMPPSINLDNGARPVAYTWLVDAKVNEVPGSLKDIINNNLSFIYREVSKNVISSESSESSESSKISEGERDKLFFHLANHLVKGGMQTDNIRYFLNLFLLYGCEEGVKPYTPQEIEIKIKSALKRDETKKSNLVKEVREFVESSKGVFFSSDCRQESSESSSPAEKKNLSKILSRLCDEGIIERYGNRYGQFRKVEETVFENWFDTDTSSLDIRLPFGMEKYVLTYPGDLIVIAGVKNAGKTALALEMIRLNKSRYDCYYHSSEIVKQVFRLRISKCENTTLEDWKMVKMSHGLSMINAKDRVVKDALNVFDYIEEGDESEYFKIPGTMARIHRELGNGIGIICLQKKRGEKTGRGGEGTKDKASLYLTIDKEYPYHIMRIEECKIFREGGENPEGFLMRYKIKNGINLLPQGILEPEMED